MAVAKWFGVLSTTEPRNDVGIIKVRQGNVNSEIAEFQIIQNNKPYDLTGLTVYFCASFGLNLVEKPAVVVNTTGGKIQYTFDGDSMQSVGRQIAYFSIKKEGSKIDSTQDFEFQVDSSLMTRSIDGKSYIYELSILIKLLDDFTKNGQNDFETWFGSVQEMLYGVDPGGNILRELSQIVSFDKKNLRPETYNYDYEQSPSKTYPNFLSRLNKGDITKNVVVFAGDSHTSGQGATEIGGEKVPQLSPPSGNTDGFHKRDNSSGVFADKIARALKKAYGLSITKRTVSNSETTYYNLPTGAWTQATDQRMLDASGQPAFHTSLTIGNSFIKKFDNSKQQRCATIHFIKLPNGGKLDVLLRTNNPSVSGLTRDDAFVWKKPSELGLVRSDGATGTDMDTIDLYAASADYGYSLGFTFPFFANWHMKFTVASSKNTASTGNLCGIGTTVLDHENFINAGRGNHTTLDYLGNTVTKGAGSGGDHTDHVSEILALKPSLVILEIMIINDWFHGQSLQDTVTCIQEMIRRFKKAGCDVLLITPGPVITEDIVLDYAENLNYETNPPLLNNLNNQGNYEDYIDAALKAAYWEQVPVINNYKYFLERFNKEDHENWTIGTQAGRIHVNQHGHDIYADGIIQFSGLFPKTILS